MKVPSWSKSKSSPVPGPACEWNSPTAGSRPRGLFMDVAVTATEGCCGRAINGRDGNQVIVYVLAHEVNDMG